MTEPVLAALQQWLLFSSTVLAVGCVTWRLIVAPRAARSLSAADVAALGEAERRVARIGVAATLVLVVAWLLRLVVQVLGYHFPGDPLWPDVSFLLFENFWGSVWMAQGAAAVLLAAAFWLAPARRSGAGDGAPGSGSSRPAPAPAWLGAAVLALSVVTTLALSSHAMGVDSVRALAVTADALHALAAGTWIGSLALILLTGRAARPELGSSAYAAQLRSFSPLAIVSVAVLLSMGVALAWTHLTAISDFWTTTYGRLLAGKIVLAAGVLGVGLWNWRRGLSEVQGESGARRVQRTASTEVSLAVAVLLITAVLVHSPKP